MDREPIRRLLERYSEGKCTPSEERQVEHLLLSKVQFTDWDWKSDVDKLRRKDEIRQAIGSALADRPHRRLISYFSGGIAACVLLGIFMLHFASRNVHRIVREDVIDNKNVVLQMDGGTTVLLGKLDESGLTLSEHVQVFDVSETGAHFKTIDNHKIHDTSMLTVSVPPRKQFSLVLPDGSKVWLNTNSSLRFPAQFGGNERVVYLDGEGFFEVAADKLHPFKVIAKQAEVVATGTAFNVSGYASDNRVIASLLEGHVQVWKSGSETISLPAGYEVSCYDGEGVGMPHVADMDRVLAWKNGAFSFDDKTIVAALREVARWYDVVIEVEEGVTHEVLGGSVSMEVTLEEFLKTLQRLANIDFEITKEKVLIKPADTH